MHTIFPFHTDHPREVPLPLPPLPKFCMQPTPFGGWAFMLLFYHWLFSTSLCSLSRYPNSFVRRISKQVVPAGGYKAGILCPWIPPSTIHISILPIYAVFTFQSSRDIVVCIFDSIFLCLCCVFFGLQSQPHIISNGNRKTLTWGEFRDPNKWVWVSQKTEISQIPFHFPLVV